MSNMIEVKNLCISYENFALNNVSFTLPAGAIMGLIGENGKRYKLKLIYTI